MKLHISRSRVNVVALTVSFWIRINLLFQTFIIRTQQMNNSLHTVLDFPFAGDIIHSQCIILVYRKPDLTCALFHDFYSHASYKIGRST